MTQHGPFPPRQPGRRPTYGDGYRQSPDQPTYRPAVDEPRRGLDDTRGERHAGWAQPPETRSGRDEQQVPRGHGEQAPRGRDARREAPRGGLREESPRRESAADEDLPSWAGLGPDGRPQPSRGDRSSARRKKRRLIMAGSAVVVVAAAVAGYFVFGGHSGPADVVSGDLITTFLPGEVQQVPNACDAIGSATLSQYMPGKLKVAAPPLNTGMESQCTWTLDDAPTYRVLELDIHAYSPSGLASGDGSATFAAIDAFAVAQQAKQDPGKKSGEPAAQMSTLKGVGTAAFVASQVFHSGGATTYMVTEVVRYRNVLVTVVVDGLDETTGAKHYGPVTMSDLMTAAEASAQGATTKVIG